MYLSLLPFFYIFSLSSYSSFFYFPSFLSCVREGRFNITNYRTSQLTIEVLVLWSTPPTSPSYEPDTSKPQAIYVNISSKLRLTLCKLGTVRTSGSDCDYLPWLLGGH